MNIEIGLDGLETEIKIIRLVTGEDLIALVTVKEDYLVLEDALHISTKLIEGTTVILFYPWLSMDIVEDNVSKIYNDKIITMVDPKMRIIEKYFSVVEELDNYQILKEEELDLEEQGNVKINSESLN